MSLTLVTKGWISGGTGGADVHIWKLPLEGSINNKLVLTAEIVNKIILTGVINAD